MKQRLINELAVCMASTLPHTGRSVGSMTTPGQRSRAYAMTAVTLLSLCPIAPAEADPTNGVCAQLDSLATGTMDGTTANPVYTCGMNYSPGQVDQSIANGDVEEEYFAVSPNLFGPGGTPKGNGEIPNATPVSYSSFSTTDSNGVELDCGVSTFVDENGVYLQAMQCVAPEYYAAPTWSDFYS